MTVLTGALISESLRVGARIEGVPLTVRSIARADVGDVDAGQPRTWTFAELELPAEHGEAFAAQLREALDPSLGWYCDFGSSDETWVVFAGRSFHYPRGDEAGRAEAIAHGRSVGVPEHQLDWPER